MLFCRIINDNEIIGIGTPSSKADSIVQLVVLLADITSGVFSKCGSFSKALATNSNNQPRITLDLESEVATCFKS